MRPLRVLYVSDKADIVGGGEISLLHLISGLQAAGGIEPLLAVPAPGELSARAEAQDLSVVMLPQPRIRARPWSLPGLRKAAGRVISGIQPDLIHANSARSMLIAGVAGRRSGIPVVWHVRVEGRDIFDRSLASNASLIITPTRVVASRYPSAEVHVIPNPIPVHEVDPGSEDRDQLRSRYLQGEDYLLLAVGELGPHKGYFRVIKALAQLDPSLSWQLLICGREAADGAGFRRKLEELIAIRDLKDSVHLLGFREDVPELMLASDLLIHAPDFEGFGRVFVEAMAAGLPLAVSPAGGLKELHEETGLGWVAEDMTPETLARTVEKALGNREGRESFRTVAPGMAAEKYSVEMHAARVKELYLKLLDNDGSTIETPA